MKRRKFLQLLGITSAMLATPAYAYIGKDEDIKRYRALLDLPTYGADDENGNFHQLYNQRGIQKGDILIRVGYEITEPTFLYWKWDRVYNETQGIMLRMQHYDAVWSDTAKNNVPWFGPVNPWFELLE